MNHAWVFKLVGTIACMLLWLWLFSYGVTVPSIDLVRGVRELQSPFSGPMLRWIFAATITNIFFLCLFTGVLGAGYRHIHAYQAEPANPVSLERLFSDLASGAARAFFAYLLFLSGIIVVVDKPVASLMQASPEQYAKIGAAVSVLSFLVGWRPEILTKAVGKLEQIHVSGSTSLPT